MLSFAEEFVKWIQKLLIVLPEDQFVSDNKQD